MVQSALFAEALPSISFEVKGAPVPQGSKTAFVQGRRAVLVDVADQKTKTMPKNRLKDWRARIALAAAEQMGGGETWQGPIVLECEFVIPRSKSHFTGAGNLAKSAPTIPTGDLDKLIRAVGDALSRVVYHDDVQVIGFGDSTKRFATKLDAVGGVKVRVRCV